MARNNSRAKGMVPSRQGKQTAKGKHVQPPFQNTGRKIHPKKVAGQHAKRTRPWRKTRNQNTKKKKKERYLWGPHIQIKNKTNRRAVQKTTGGLIHWKIGFRRKGKTVVLLRVKKSPERRHDPGKKLRKKEGQNDTDQGKERSGGKTSVDGKIADLKSPLSEKGGNKPPLLGKGNLGGRPFPGGGGVVFADVKGGGGAKGWSLGGKKRNSMQKGSPEGAKPSHSR